MQRIYDTLSIGNGDNASDVYSIIAILTGETSVRLLTSQRSEMWILMEADHWVAYSGFELTVERSQSGATTGLCNSQVSSC